MRRIRTHRLGVDQGSQVLFSDFEHDGEMWTGEGPREFRMAVQFSDEGFTDAPMVQVGMSMWDLDQKTNQRVDIAAENITVKGFEIVFRTWGDTRVARVRADWIAMGEVEDEDDWSLD
ncbi:H-type lectin domain-containing protein [Aliiroseovarius sp.]|uniref:H-type lectin domain-containing protein n=1 Tax=Aliiroseovarius sp. TaxID=1872442 RepID=UPI00260AE4B5|nr:H-type lectin domain-containing protein [Aliiroseovarius sp.]